MNRHQVLTGAANNLDHSVSVGSVENNHFTVSYLILTKYQFTEKKIISRYNSI